jgi:hypothetical protein
MKEPYLQRTSLALVEQVKTQQEDHDKQQHDAHLTCLTGLGMDSTLLKCTTNRRKNKFPPTNAHIVEKGDATTLHNDCTYKDFLIIRRGACVVQDVAALCLKLLQNTTMIPLSAILFRQSYMAAEFTTHKDADYG